MLCCFTKTCEAEGGARQDLFARDRSVKNISPTQGALVQHVHRAAFQAGYIWNQALKPQQQLPSPSDWGFMDQLVIAKFSNEIACAIGFCYTILASNRGSFPANYSLTLHATKVFHLK